MKDHVMRLSRIAQKERRKIIGLMSGTSLDGLDVALCTISGSGSSTQVKLENFKTFAYTEEDKNEIRKVFAKKTADLQQLCLLNGWIGERHASMINSCLQEWDVLSENIDLIASHGQTIFHAPLHMHGQQKFGNGTLQIGDGDRIAVGTGIITLSDFRQKHIAGGGEGAPLAAYGDLILFGGKDDDTILLNIGGISNFTFIPSKNSDSKFFSSDIGPGNTLMDAWMKKHDNTKDYDKDGSFAASGRTIEQLLNKLMTHPFFEMPFPKSTGPEDFNLSLVEQALISEKPEPKPEDVMATLLDLTALSISRAILNLPRGGLKANIFLSGGGVHNLLLVKKIKDHLPGYTVRSIKELGIDPDAKEAMLFAILANETIAGSLIKGYGLPEISMGKISFPK